MKLNPIHVKFTFIRLILGNPVHVIMSWVESGEDRIKETTVITVLNIDEGFGLLQFLGKREVTASGERSVSSNTQVQVIDFI